MRNFETGFIAESIVSRHLEENGYTVLDHNWRRPWGEIDIVAEKSGVLVFIEVKAATAQNPGFEPELRANSVKMAKVVRTARSYLVHNRYSDDKEWQVDIISVLLDIDGKTAKIKHFKNVEI
jgi:putative endonuclease